MASEKKVDVVPDWTAVIGKALAFLCLQQPGLSEQGMGAQAIFLESLGLPRADIAALLGTTAASLNQQIHVARKKGTNGGKVGKKRKSA